MAAPELTPEEMTEILRGLDKQWWAWDHVGVWVPEKRAANRSAARKIIAEGGQLPGNR